MKYLVLLLLLCSCQHKNTNKHTDHYLVKEGVSLNVYRESLASNINQNRPIDFNIFKKTCMPVGKRIKKIKSKKGINVKQISHKNRNPKNYVPDNLAVYYNEFLSSNKLDHKLFTIDKTVFAMVRISVQESCLACHGEYYSRPEFIQKNYPKDKAHSFKLGDLRGVYIINEI